MLLLFTSAADAPALFWVGAGALMGISGAAHCAGMCGAFPLAVGSASRSRTERLLRSATYNAGRISTYVVLGALAATLGLALGGAAAKVEWLADAGRALAITLTIATGLVIAISGLFLLGVRLPFIRKGHTGFFADLVANGGRGLMRSKSPVAPLALGLLNGVLPCPLVYAMLASAFSLGALKLWPAALLLALSFALATLPVMLGLGLIAGSFSINARPALARIAGVVLLLFASVTVVRGVSMDSLHAVIPGGHSNHTAHAAMPGHFEVGGKHFDANGILIERNPTMDDEAYRKLVEEEARLAREKAALLQDADEARLRAHDATISRPEGTRAWTLTKRDLLEIMADKDAPKEWTYRCACCGTPKQAAKDDLMEGATLLFPADAPNPWKSRRDATSTGSE